MFVQYLNERQQGALLHYAHEMMRVDGEVGGEELALLDLLRDQAQPGVEAEDVPLKDLAGLFDDRLTRVAFSSRSSGWASQTKISTPPKTSSLAT